MSSSGSLAGPDGLWMSHALVGFQSLALPLALWFKPACVIFAMSWLIYRAVQVLHKPLDELASLLGFDIPLAPTIDLASVKADGALVRWTSPERLKSRTSLKYEIHLNGTAIDAVSVSESAVTITGLQPGAFYVIRVALVNNMEFSSKSAPIRFCTKPASSGDFFVVSSDALDVEHGVVHEPVPRIQPFRGLKDLPPAFASATTAATRENGTGPAPRRMTSSRRLSPAVIDVRPAATADDAEAREGPETVQLLTERLDAVRRETDEAEKLLKDEDDDERKQKEELVKERDDLKAEFAEKEKASRNLKREVNMLERQNTAAQNERAKQERLLAQKKQEREKVRDDLVRWAREVEDMKAEVERIKLAKSDLLEHVVREKEELLRKQAEEAANLESLEDEVKEKRAEVKKLERSLKNGSPNGVESAEPSLVQQLQQDAEDERAWQNHRQMLLQQYSMAFQKMESAKRFHTEQMRYLDSMRAERRRTEEVSQYASPPASQERTVGRAEGQRRAVHRHSLPESPLLSNNFVAHPNPYTSSMTNIATSSFSTAPFLNLQNGMTLSTQSNLHGLSEEDREKLTGGALMSPGAGAELIPADLFSGEIDRVERVPLLPGLGSLPGLPGLPDPPSVTADGGPGPASPASASSRSPSIFASPLGSSHNLYLGSPENIIDVDRRSIRSTRSHRAASGTGSRFSALFGIKPRTKTMSEEGPALSKASSMPRQDQGIPGLYSYHRKRNSSISGTMLADLGTDDTPADVSELSSAAPSKRHFGLFSREKTGGWPAFTGRVRRPASPRPGSTHSTELPRPPLDTGRWGVDTWPSGDAGSVRGNSLSFGQGWNAQGSQPRITYGSRHPSRRPSVQYGAGPPEDIMEADDDVSDVLNSAGEPNLPPIGTKPSASSSKKAVDNAAKLNPNAKDFKSFFTSMKLSKTKDSSALSEKTSSPIHSAVTTPYLGGPDNDESPPNSRKSRDTRSLHTTESSIAESGRNSTDLTRTPSHSTSDAPAPSPSLPGSSKESFMAKMSRKKSSSKFTLPTFRQREKARLDAAGSNSSVATSVMTPSQSHVEDEEESLSTSVGSVRERDANRTSGRSWGSMFKLGKASAKKENETPSISGMSLASGTEDGEGEGDEGEGTWA